MQKRSLSLSFTSDHTFTYIFFFIFENHFNVYTYKSFNNRKRKKKSLWLYLALQNRFNRRSDQYFQNEKKTTEKSAHYLPTFIYRICLKCFIFFLHISFYFCIISHCIFIFMALLWNMFQFFTFLFYFSQENLNSAQLSSAQTWHEM